MAPSIRSHYGQIIEYIPGKNNHFLRASECAFRAGAYLRVRLHLFELPAVHCTSTLHVTDSTVYSYTSISTTITTAKHHF